jgi:hypothetical protein
MRVAAVSAVWNMLVSTTPFVWASMAVRNGRPYRSAPRGFMPAPPVEMTLTSRLAEVKPPLGMVGNTKGMT